MVQDENKQSVQETEENHESQTPTQENAEVEPAPPENQEVKGESTESTTPESSEEPEPVSEPVDSEKSTEPTTIKLEDIVEEQEYSSEEIEKFEQIYESTISKYSEGEIISGRILAIDAKEVSVDIGFKSEGIVPIEEFSNIDELKPGDEIEVFIDNLEDKDGQLILSRKKADFMRSWERVVDMFEKGETSTGKITRRIKGGMVVDMLGVEAFLPGSQIDVKPIRDFDALVSQEFEFKIVNVNQMRKNIVVSRRVLIEDEMKGQREKIISDLEKGQILEGTVKNITDFGVFIDLGGVDGLLHINDLSWGRIGHPSEVVSLDQKINVMVLDYDENKNRISLGYKQLQPHPWDQVNERYPVGEKISGKVVNIADYGAFIELEKGIEGLIHISEMSWTQHIKHPTQLLKLGDIVEAVILSVEKEEHKISLGLKQMQPDPWEEIEKRYPVGTRHKGIVRNLTNFGAFIELEEGVDGLVHISDLSWTRKIRHPSEVIRKNDEIEVEVLAIDQDNRRISLGYKQIFENPWDVLEDRYKVAVQIKGKVTRCIDKGVIVEIPDEVEGFVPVSHLKRMEKPGFKRTSDAYKIDNEMELVVIEFDKSNKRIVLSERDPEELKNLPGLKEEEKYPEELEHDIPVKKPGKKEIESKKTDETKSKGKEVEVEKEPISETETVAEVTEQKTEEEASSEVATPVEEVKEETIQEETKPEETTEVPAEEDKKEKSPEAVTEPKVEVEPEEKKEEEKTEKPKRKPRKTKTTAAKKDESESKAETKVADEKTLAEETKKKEKKTKSKPKEKDTESK